MRRRIAVFALTSLAALPRAWSQARRFAALSFVGDRIEIVAARASVGSHLDSNSRGAIDDGQGAMDRLAVLALHKAISRVEPGATLAMLALPGSALYDQPERLYDGRQIALPGPVVDAIVASKATHLIVLTKLRDAVRVPLLDSVVGSGTARGLGFYVDNDIQLRMSDSGSRAPGLLAPFVYVRVTLVDLGTGEVVREEPIRAMQSYATASNPNATLPWDVLSASEKIDALRQLLDRSIDDAAARLLR